MGSCCSKLSDDEKQYIARSQAIDNFQSSDRVHEKRVVKLLLLGTGESGKSTIFKQMHVLYSQGFTPLQREQYKAVIRKNILEGLQALVLAVKKFKYSYSSAEATKCATALQTMEFSDPNFWTAEVGKYVKILWGGANESLKGDPAIRQAYELRSKFQLSDSVVYFFESVDRIMNSSYTPIDQDILRARLRTTGIVENTFLIDNVDFRFLDVGGQRNERRKWIHCFQDVTAIIFVTAISEYDQCLFEDEKQNRLLESLKVFDDICNKSYFARTSMILFLNKFDLFEDKIQSVDLNCCFPEYTGGCDCDAAIEFIRDKFLNLNRSIASKDIYYHFTCATDTNNVERVFNDCRRIIIRRSLETSGLAIY